jgi:hypothetical protein
MMDPAPPQTPAVVATPFTAWPLCPAGAVWVPAGWAVA